MKSAIRAAATSKTVSTVIRSGIRVVGAYFEGIAFEHGRQHGAEMDLSDPRNIRRQLREWRRVVMRPSPLEMTETGDPGNHPNHAPAAAGATVPGPRPGQPGAAQ
jgi:hypothetical protein